MQFARLLSTIAVIAAIASTSLFEGVEAHGQLSAPKPFNTKPFRAKKDACGVPLPAGMQATATVVAGQTTKAFVWQIRNGDGLGPLTAEIDTTATANFATSIKPTIVVDVPGEKGKDIAGQTRLRGLQPFSITIPAGLKCTGGSTKDMCILRMSQPAGFVSCAAFKVGAAEKVEQLLGIKSSDDESVATEDKEDVAYGSLSSESSGQNSVAAAALSTVAVAAVAAMI